MQKIDIRLRWYFVAFVTLIVLTSCPAPSGPSQSSDANLQSLTITAGGVPLPLQPPFNPAITEYRVTVPLGTTSITFAALTRDVSASLVQDSIIGLASDGVTPLTPGPLTPAGQTITGLTSGENLLRGSVIAQDGSLKTYILIIDVARTPIRLQVAQRGLLMEQDLTSDFILSFSLENIDLAASGLTITVPLTYDDPAGQVGGGHVNSLTFNSTTPTPSITLLGRSDDDGNTESEAVTLQFGTPIITGTNNENYQVILPENLVFYAVDDDGTAVTAAFSTGTVNEGASENLVLSLQNPGTESVTVTPSAQELTFAPGSVTLSSTNPSATIAVTAQENDEDEPSQTVAVSLESSDPAIRIQPSTLNLSVLDNDVPAITLDAADTLREGQNIEVSLSINPIPYQNVSVDYAFTVSGGRTLSDYIAPAFQTGTLVLQANQGTYSVAVPTIDNDVDDIVATVPLTLTLSNPAPSGGATIATAAETIALEDNDLTAVSLSSSNSRTSEESGTATFTFTLAKAISEITTVRYTVTPLANSAGEGVTPENAWSGISTGEVNIAAGSTTASITATAQGNTERASFPQGLMVRITEVVSDNFIVKVDTEAREETLQFIDDEAPVVSIERTASNANIREGDTASFTVNLEDSSGAAYTPTNPVTIQYSHGAGSSGATPYEDGSDGEDWENPGTSITIPAGSSSGTINVRIQNNPEDEGITEVLMISLESAQENGQNVELHLTENSAFYNLVDTPHITVTRGHTDAIAEDDGTLTFTLSRTQGLAITQSISYAIGGITTRGDDTVSALSSSDYSYVDSDGAGTSGDGTVRFGINESSVTITITATNDSIYEVEQWGRLTLTQASDFTYFIPEESLIHDFSVADDDIPLILSVETQEGTGFDITEISNRVIFTVRTSDSVTAVQVYKTGTSSADLGALTRVSSGLFRAELATNSDQTAPHRIVATAGTVQQNHDFHVVTSDSSPIWNNFPYTYTASAPEE